MQQRRGTEGQPGDIHLIQCIPYLVGKLVGVACFEIPENVADLRSSGRLARPFTSADVGQGFSTSAFVRTRKAAPKLPAPSKLGGDVNAA
jgi:hypothetical protein